MVAAKPLESNPNHDDLNQSVPPKILHSPTQDSYKTFENEQRLVFEDSKYLFECTGITGIMVFLAKFKNFFSNKSLPTSNVGTNSDHKINPTFQDFFTDFCQLVHIMNEDTHSEKVIKAYNAFIEELNSEG